MTCFISAEGLPPFRVPDLQAGRTDFSFLQPFLLMSLGYFDRFGLFCGVLISENLYDLAPQNSPF